MKNMERATVYDVAKELNISAGTVSKALSGKTGVSRQMRVRVETAARRLGYSANISAQGLARNPINIGVITPKVWLEFFGYQKYGVEAEINLLQDQRIQGQFASVSGLLVYEEYRSILTGFLDAQMDAVIISTADTTPFADCLDVLHDKGVKVVFLGNTVGEGKRFAEIRMASDVAGSLAAEYAAALCRRDKSAAVFIENNNMEDHGRKAEYFRRVAAGKKLAVCGVYETQNDADIAYIVTEKVLSEQPDLGLIFVGTCNSVAVCRCIQDMDASERVKVIATDIFPDMTPFVDAGIVVASIYQNPIRMGRLAVRAIYDAISTGKRAEDSIVVIPQLVLRSNYMFYADYLKQIEAEAAVDMSKYPAFAR